MDEGNPTSVQNVDLQVLRKFLCVGKLSIYLDTD